MPGEHVERTFRARSDRNRGDAAAVAVALPTVPAMWPSQPAVVVGPMIDEEAAERVCLCGHCLALRAHVSPSHLYPATALLVRSVGLVGLWFEGFHSSRKRAVRMG